MKKSAQLDQNAHALIQKVKGIMEGEGYSSPSVSDAIRWLCEKAGVK